MNDPGWVRSCDDCRQFVMGDNGEVSTYPSYSPQGERIELPMIREPGDEPPCNVCPKIPEGESKHWSNATEFEPWFWRLRSWFNECRAIGDFGNPDPFMRAVAAAFDLASREQQERRGQWIEAYLKHFRGR
jgi:hypothetical protein